MEPLSIALAAVSLATAVKDVIEISERIEGSFSKVSENNQNVQTLALEIIATVNKLKEFCDHHREVLNAAESRTQTTLLDLENKLNSTLTKCIQLLPVLSYKRLDRCKIRLQKWRDRHRIEAAISELKEEVKSFYSEFMIFSLTLNKQHNIFRDAGARQSVSGVSPDITAHMHHNLMLTS